MLFKKLFFCVFFFSTFLMFAQTDTGEAFNTKLIKINNDIYMLQGKGGNIGLSFGSDGIFMIDDQFAEGIEQIQKDIEKKSKKPIRFIVNTHFHDDHTGGNAAMAKTGAIIFSQENTRTRMEEMINKEVKKIPQETLPVITFSENLTFYFNNEKIYVFHVHNAHTDGDVMVYFTKNNVLHTGDVFFNGKYPFIDLEHGGSVKGCVEGLAKALTIINKDTKIIPGHGGVGTYQDVKNTINMLSSIYKRVTVEYMKKKTEDEVAKMTNLTSIYDNKGYGDGFITKEAFLRTVYKEVAIDRKPDDERNKKNEAARKRMEEIKKQREAENKK